MIDKNFFDTVSRETLKDFLIFEKLLKKWNRTMNLVSVSTLEQFMVRHILDSVQLVRYCEKKNGLWLDIGSGGGFPGIPMAIYARHYYPKFEFYLLDSNSKKCTFLQEVCRHLNIETKIICDRVENVPAIQCEYIVSRALAPLSDLLNYSKRHRKKNGKSLFLKGNNVFNELLIAKDSWVFSYNIHQSLSHNSGKVVEITNHDLLKSPAGGGNEL